MSMRKPTFSLQSPLSSEIIDVPAPDWLNLYVCGYDIQVQRGQKLAAGAELARHPKPLGGVVHAPMSAVVDKADFAYVTMKASAALDPLPPMDIPEDTEGLREALRTLGVRMDRFMLNREILVINGVNPEPTVSVAEQLMRDAQPTLLRGLEAVRKLIAPQRMVLVTATLDQNLPGCETVRVKPDVPQLPVRPRGSRRHGAGEAGKHHRGQRHEALVHRPDHGDRDVR
jgi:Predicted NADH:ubiquinone oxidoreductase, subunit RnfC